MTDKEMEIAAKLGMPYNRTAIGRIVKKYPWFFTARAIIETGNETYDPAMSLHLMLHPTPAAMLHKLQDSDFDNNIETSETDPQFVGIEIETADDEADKIIDMFLKRGASRVVPKDDTPEFDAALESGQLDISDDMATQELADIYMKQGLIRQAETIYNKLKNK